MLLGYLIASMPNSPTGGPQSYRQPPVYRGRIISRLQTHTERSGECLVKRREEQEEGMMAGLEASSRLAGSRVWTLGEQPMRTGRRTCVQGRHGQGALWLGV